MRVGEAIEAYLQAISINMAAGSVKVYRSRLLHMVRALGDERLGDVKRSQLEQVVIAYRKGRKNSTVALLVAAMRGFWDWCIDEEYIEHSPAARIKAPRRGERLPRSLGEDTARNITMVCLDALKSPDWRIVRNGALVLLLRYAGLRRAEARDLTWRDVDLKAGFVIVRGKGNKERRIPLHRQAARALTCLGSLRGQKGFVFHRDDGSMLSLTAINQVIFDEWLCEEIGEHVTPHQLRHTFATELMERGAQLDEVAGLCGHKSVSTTQVYVAMSPERLRQAIDLL